MFCPFNAGKTLNQSLNKIDTHCIQPHLFPMRNSLFTDFMILQRERERERECVCVWIKDILFLLERCQPHSANKFSFFHLPHFHRPASDIFLIRILFSLHRWETEFPFHCKSRSPDSQTKAIPAMPGTSIRPVHHSRCIKIFYIKHL